MERTVSVNPVYSKGQEAPRNQVDAPISTPFVHLPCLAPAGRPIVSMVSYKALFVSADWAPSEARVSSRRPERRPGGCEGAESSPGSGSSGATPASSEVP